MALIIDPTLKELYQGTKAKVVSTAKVLAEQLKKTYASSALAESFQKPQAAPLDINAWLSDEAHQKAVTGAPVAAPATAKPAATSTSATSASGTTPLAATTPAPVVSPPLPEVAAYNGLTSDQYREQLVAAVRSGVMTEYEANASVIKNNLAKALSDLQAEKAALEPLYQNQLDTIASNKFATGEATKEMMNQAGWNTANSGLAVGEQTKIANAANKEKAAALQAKTTTETDINRRTSLAGETYGNDLASIEAQKNAKLSGAEAEAMIQAEDRNRSTYESDRSYDLQRQQLTQAASEADRSYNLQQQQFAESVRQFNAQLAESKASRTASQKAAALQTEATTTAAEKEAMHNALVSKLYTAPTQQAAMTYLRDMMSDESIPDSIKAQLQKDAETLIKMINADGTVYNPNAGQYDWLTATGEAK